MGAKADALVAAMSRVYGLVRYEPDVPGDTGNYRWPVTFDYTEDGYLGISQTQEDGAHPARVLLSPGQLAVLKAFTRRRPTGG